MFQGDEITGKGIKNWTITGDVYEGEFHKGMQHGQGKYTWSNGESFEGQWIKGKKEG